MAQNSINMTEKGRTYTVTGDHVGRALTYFTALIVLRTIRGFVLGFFSAYGASVVLAHFLHF
jgi:hypothetical protein